MYSCGLQITFDINYSQFGIHEERKALSIITLSIILNLSLSAEAGCSSKNDEGLCDEWIFSHCWVQGSICAPYNTLVRCAVQIFYYLF